MILTPVSLLNMNQKKNSIPKQISKPNPPTPEMIERAQIQGQDVQMEREVNLIFDIETDGLLENVTTIHCLVIHDLETKKRIRTTTQEIKNLFRGGYKGSMMQTHYWSQHCWLRPTCY